MHQPLRAAHPQQWPTCSRRKLARQIGEELGKRLGLTPVYIDERFSSVEAEEALLRLDLSRKKRKQVIDQAAAILILQSWLDHGDWTQAR